MDNAIIVNTCAVTGEAVKQAGQAIRRARRENPRARIIVTGCAAQIEPERFAEMPEVDHVIGNDGKMLAETYRSLLGESRLPRVAVTDIMAVKAAAGHLISGPGSRPRAYVEIQNGCDHRCTFCIIPFGRGNSRSVPAGEVVAQIRNFAEQGIAEVVLAGVDITGYGRDLPGNLTLGKLVQKILRLVPELQRLRLSSIDSIEADEPLIDAIASESRLMPHLHLSLQAGDDLTLKRMKRRHLRADSIQFCADIRKARPDIALGADLIAGFPTETDEMFENTLNLVDECGLDHLHVFPFSSRPGTPAARMPQVPKAEIKARAARLRAKGEQALQRHLASFDGKHVSVLAENERQGRTPQFTGIKLDQPLRPGALLVACVTGHDGQRLTGVIVNE